MKTINGLIFAVTALSFWAAWTIFGPVKAQSIPGQALQSLTIFDTGPFICDGAKNWSWDVPDAIAVRKAKSWQGMDMGSLADFSMVLYKQSDQTFLFRYNWDHYAEPKGANDQIVDQDFSPDYILLEKGESLVLDSVCLNYSGHPTHGHIVVLIWFTLIP